MNLFTLKAFEWEGRQYRPGEHITVHDPAIAQLLINARAVDAGERNATAPPQPFSSRVPKRTRFTGPVLAVPFIFK